MFEDLQQFKQTYINECLELLSDMEERLLGLSEEKADKEMLNAIFRCAHSIKGGAGAFGFTQIAKFTHILEALLDKLREGEITASRQVIDTLLKARDVVLKMVIAARDGQALPEGYGQDIASTLSTLCNLPAPHAVQPVENMTPLKGGKKSYIIEFKPYRDMMSHGNDPLLLLRELKRLGDCNIEADYSRLPVLQQCDAEQCYLAWNVTLTTDKKEADIREVFEFVDGECELKIQAIIDLAQKDTASPAVPTKESTPKAAEPANTTLVANAIASSIRVDIDKVDRLINMVGEIVIIQAMLSMQSRFLSAPEHSELARGINELTTHTRELQEAVMAVRMQPVKSIFSRMPRLVRDLSGQLHKDIRLIMSGENTEVDKTIIEQLSDPLTHMIRNSIDHGVEVPEKRHAAGKTPQGTITLSASHRGGRIVIEVGDDGSGINREKVLAKAKEKGLVAPDAQLSDADVDMLIFAPGFSTAEQVTNVSGRGVGMDVVRRNIESIGGTVAIHNRPGYGTLFTISLPLTLAILDGMIVRVASEHYIVPIANIIETMRPRPDDVRNIADGQSVINVRGEFIPVLYLHRLFGIHDAILDASKGLVVLVENGNEQLGLVVDELVGQQQVVIKTLEENADPVAGVSGATILGDGKVSLILDITGLRRMTHRALPHNAQTPIKYAA